jgi:hypothetical protein
VVVGGSHGRREWRSEGVAVGKDWWSEGGGGHVVMAMGSGWWSEGAVVVVIRNGGRREWWSVKSI